MTVAFDEDLLAPTLAGWQVVRRGASVRFGRGGLAAGRRFARPHCGGRGGGRGRRKRVHGEDRQLRLHPGDLDRHGRHNGDLEKTRDDSPHRIGDKNGTFKSAALDTDDTFSHTFAAPGEYPYICTIHPYMAGKIIVKPAGPARWSSSLLLWKEELYSTG